MTLQTTGGNRLPPEDVDTICRILSNDTRRAVVDYLTSNGGTDKGSLADHLSDGPIDQPRTNILISLYQWHLPKMADEGVIEYDERSGAVEPGPLFEQTQYILGAGR